MAAARPWMADSAIALAVCCGCWFAGVAYLRTAASPPTGLAIGALLLAVPAAILSALWFGRSAARAHTSPATAALPAAAAADAAPCAALPVIAAGAVRLRGGDTTEALAEALRTSSAPCELDHELTDDAGYPVLSGRVENADPASAHEVMGAWLEKHGRAEPGYSDEQWRALAMGGAVVAELAQHALMHPLLADYLASAPDDRAAVALPTLHLAALLPQEWTCAQRQAAQEWLLHLVEQQGWPAQHLRLSPDGAPEFSLGAALRNASGLTLLLACASHVGDDTVREWHDRGMLFTCRTPRGQVPGEGAAGLLLADPAQAALLPASSLATLDGACEARLDARGNGDVLAKLVRQSLEESKTDPASVTAICADADLRPLRMGEVMGMANTVLPHLELDSAMMSVGACCGTAGAVGTLAALALAAQNAHASGAPVLCVSNAEAGYRFAILVRAA